MKTREELRVLQTNWRSDPCWDIEETEGFEEYREELKTYRSFVEDMWREDKYRRLVRMSNKYACSIELAEHIELLENRLAQLEAKS